MEEIIFKLSIKGERLIDWLRVCVCGENLSEEDTGGEPVWGKAGAKAHWWEKHDVFWKCKLDVCCVVRVLKKEQSDGEVWNPDYGKFLMLFLGAYFI